MLSLINVTCPHCAARGQVIIPPLGGIIIGPCPECHKSVVLYNGVVLPLDDAIITGDDRDQKCEHLLEVITDYLRGRIARVFDEEANNLTARKNDSGSQVNDPPTAENIHGNANEADIAPAAWTVSDQEWQELDDADTFRRIFGK